MQQGGENVSESRMAYNFHCPTLSLKFGEINHTRAAAVIVGERPLSSFMSIGT